MDFPTVSLADWPGFDALAHLPDTLLAALVSSVATLVLLAVLAPRLMFAARRPAVVEPDDPGVCEFLIDGASLRPLGEPARALLDTLPAVGTRLAALVAYLEPECPGVRTDLEALVLYGIAFRHHCSRRDGTAFEVLGQPRGGAAHVSIRPASEDARALQDTQAALVQAGAQARFLADVLDRAPVLAWTIGPDGQVAWANAAYRDRFTTPNPDLPDHRLPDGFGHLLEEVPLTSRSGGTRRRVAIAGRRDAEPHWFEICQAADPDGAMLGFATDADDLVAAEGSLRRFVETLTETFAHLPIGLAVFDKNRRLGLFNPALTDLVKIDAVWLAGRPSLRDFLERLRETRQMPDQKDFASFRRKLGELEEGARDGTYEENWVLPSGKIFRVTGRPHPQGALAFLFEDISTAIILERKYRSELELSQATLDRLSEAVAVFDASGMLVFVNSAFATLWGFDPMERLQGPGVGDLTRLWSERCAPSPVWAALNEFATGAESRTSWNADVETRDGRSLQILVAPLPDASALIVFRDLTARADEIGATHARLVATGAARDHDALLDALALEQLQLPVEAAVRQVMAAIPAAQTPEAFQALSAAAQGLKDGLARSRELHALARLPDGAAASPGPLPALSGALSARGLTLALAGDDAALAAPLLRRAVTALGLAAADLATPGGLLEITIETGSAHRITLAAAGPSPASRAEGVGLALARRVVEADGGTLRLEAADGRVTLAADLPLAPVRTGTPLRTGALRA